MLSLDCFLISHSTTRSSYYTLSKVGMTAAGFFFSQFLRVAFPSVVFRMNLLCCRSMLSLRTCVSFYHHAYSILVEEL